MPGPGSNESNGMSFMRNFICAGVVLMASSAAAFDGETLHYEIDWGLATLADAKIQLLATKSVRSVSAEIISRGVGAWFSDFQATLEIMGINGGALVLNGDSAWGDVLSSITVIWPEGDSRPLVDLFRSKPREYELTPVSDDSTADTVDPLSPLFDISLQLHQNNRCEGSYRVFDGVRRYDLQVKQGGIEVLRSGNVGEYSGEAYRCEISLIRLGGFSTKRGLFKLDESDITRTLYFGSVEGQLLPVRFEIESFFGRATARLKLIN